MGITVRAPNTDINTRYYDVDIIHHREVNKLDMREEFQEFVRQGKMPLSKLKLYVLTKYKVEAYSFEYGAGDKYSLYATNFDRKSLKMKGMPHLVDNSKPEERLYQIIRRLNRSRVWIHTHCRLVHTVRGAAMIELQKYEVY